jgi:hypothetical protein
MIPRAVSVAAPSSRAGIVGLFLNFYDSLSRRHVALRSFFLNFFLAIFSLLHVHFGFERK